MKIVNASEATRISEQSWTKIYNDLSNKMAVNIRKAAINGNTSTTMCVPCRVNKQLDALCKCLNNLGYKVTVEDRTKMSNFGAVKVIGLLINVEWQND